MTRAAFLEGRARFAAPSRRRDEANLDTIRVAYLDVVPVHETYLKLAETTALFLLVCLNVAVVSTTQLCLLSSSGGNQLSNTTCLMQVFFKRGE